MHRVTNFLSRSKPSSTTSLASLADESQALESALSAVELILSDDIAGAEAGLANGTSPFHSLCKGVLGFMKATMGFEQEVMKEASARLYAAESAAYDGYHRAQREKGSDENEIYEKGAEFSLCMAEAQIMSAVVGVLNESLTESLKGFYKLRKAYMTLEGLMRMEERWLKGQGARTLNQSRESLGSETSNRSGLANGEREVQTEAAQATHPSGLREATAAEDGEEDSDEEFYEVEAETETAIAYTGKLDMEQTSSTPPGMNSEEARHLELSPHEETHKKMLHQAPQSEEPKKGKGLKENLANMSIANDHTPSTPPTTHLPSSTTPLSSRPSTPTAPSTKRGQPATASNHLTPNADSPIFTTPLTIFIHSGTNLCFGLLSLLISAIPPAFSRLLSIIGFRGDRERGMRMLWQASKFSNINGGMAGLIILGWYNGLVGGCDIIPDPPVSQGDEEGEERQQQQVEGYPALRLKKLLVEMRTRYPKSQLWLIEEARMAASERQLDRSLTLFSSKPEKRGTLKQLEALHMFEKSFCNMHAHRYKECARSILACCDLNNWSQALYYYIAGAAHLEVYRSTSEDLSEKEKEESKKLAEEYFRVAPSKAGKKKMMGRQLPFDTFVVRKVAKWTGKAEAWNCDFIDAIGVSPLEEMAFFWNGLKKMDRANLERSLVNLSWSESERNQNWEKEEKDEKAILDVLRAVVLRNLRRHDESKEHLRVVLSQDPSAFKGPNMDDWVMPVAHYEMAVNMWMGRKEYTSIYGTDIVTLGAGVYGSETAVMSKEDIAHDRRLIGEAQTQIEKAKNWEKYILDARVGMKIKAADDAIKGWDAKHKAHTG